MGLAPGAVVPDTHNTTMSAEYHPLTHPLLSSLLPSWCLGVFTWMDHINGLCALWLLVGRMGRERGWVLPRCHSWSLPGKCSDPAIALLRATAPVGGPLQVPAHAPCCPQPQRSALLIFLHSAHTLVGGHHLFPAALTQQADSTAEICTQTF